MHLGQRRKVFTPLVWLKMGKKKDPSSSDGSSGACEGQGWTVEAVYLCMEE